MLRFGLVEAPKLTKDNLGSAAVNKFIAHIQNLIRANAFDDSVMTHLIDSAPIRLLSLYFAPTETARLHPIENHWTTDWDIATIIKALEEVYPTRPEDKHLADSTKWQQVVVEARKKARIQTNDMDQSRRNTINEWSNAEDTLGPIPPLHNDEILKELARCFTNKDNPAGSSTSNVQFQRDLNTIIKADRDYYANPTLERLCAMVTGLMHTWERLTAESHRMSEHTLSGSSSSTGRNKASKTREDQPNTTVEATKKSNGLRCEGCNRPNHTRDFCRLRTHPDFNKEGPWIGSAVERTIRGWDHSQPDVVLPWKQRSDGTPWTDPAEAPTPLKKDKPRDRDYYGGHRGNRDNDRRGNDGGSRGSGGRVHFEGRGTPCRTDIVTHLSCNCGESDVNSTYRQCLVSLSASSTYFTALTLFDTGAYTSFVNREVAKWLEQRQGGDKEGLGLDRTSSRHDIPTAVVGLAGTSMNSSIYGSVVFDLSLFNEVTRTDHVLRDIRASV